ncbi:MAG: hypothetical protein JEY79_09740 [Pseudodesulfovibrio sp.]|nr:hypothetical protein [Pseudodesulfovibrio sp.]
MLKEIYKSAITIRAYPLVVGLILATVIASGLIFFPSSIIKHLPESFFGNTHTRIQWGVFNIDNEMPPAHRVYVFGGSQVIQGFPPADQLQELADKEVGQVRIFEAAFSGQSLFDSFVLLSNLPIDGQTVVFLQISPSRFKEKARLISSSRLMLDSSEVLNEMREAGFDLADTDRTSRICRELIILATRAFRPYDKLATEAKYVDDPAQFVARLMPNPAELNKAGGQAEAKAQEALISDMDVLCVIQKYILGRGGQLYLFEMPHNVDFPKGMPGWALQEHEDQAVKGWLNRLHGNSQKDQAESTRFNQDFYQKVKESGVPFISFHSPAFYAAHNYYDSVHLRSSGRDIFLPNFFDALKSIFKTSQPTALEKTQ